MTKAWHALMALVAVSTGAMFVLIMVAQWWWGR